MNGAEMRWDKRMAERRWVSLRCGGVKWVVVVVVVICMVFGGEGGEEGRWYIGTGNVWRAAGYGVRILNWVWGNLGLG